MVGREVADKIREAQSIYLNTRFCFCSHNGHSFDMRLLFEENRANDISLPANLYSVDSMLSIMAMVTNDSTEIKKGGFKLEELHKVVLGKDLKDAHSAEGDVIGLRDLLRKLNTPLLTETEKLTSTQCMFNDVAAVSLFKLFIGYEAKKTAHETVDATKLNKYFHFSDAMYHIVDREKVKHMLSKNKPRFASSFTTNGVVLTLGVETERKHENDRIGCERLETGKEALRIRKCVLSLLGHTPAEKEEAANLTKAQKMAAARINKLAKESEVESSTTPDETNEDEDEPMEDGDEDLAVAGEGPGVQVEAPAPMEAKTEVKIIKDLSQQWAELADEILSYHKRTNFVVADMGLKHTVAALRVCNDRSVQAGSLQYKGKEQLDRCTLPYETEGWRTTVISSRSIIEASGSPGRDVERQGLLKQYRAANPHFREAEKLIIDNSLKTSNLDDQLKAIIVRSETFGTMFGFYGDARFGRDKLNNRVGLNKALDDARKKIMGPKDVFLYGLDFKSIEHLAVSSSLVAKFIERMIASGQPCHQLHDEFRTSCLNYATLQYSNHPVGQEKILTIAKREKREEERKERVKAKTDAEAEKKIEGGDTAAIGVGGEGSISTPKSGGSVVTKKRASSEVTEGGEGNRSSAQRQRRADSDENPDVNMEDNDDDDDDDDEDDEDDDDVVALNSTSSSSRQAASNNSGAMETEGDEGSIDGGGMGGLSGGSSGSSPSKSNGSALTSSNDDTEMADSGSNGNCNLKGGKDNESSSSSNGATASGSGGGGRRFKVKDGGNLKRGQVKIIKGLYVTSNRNNTHLINRDRNAIVNMAQIVRSLLDFKKIPWEFRKDTHLEKGGADGARDYSYRALRVNKHGQIEKFKREDRFKRKSGGRKKR